ARARQWSARCYGVARQRDGSRQNSTGPALIPFVTLTRARARQWSARCYGVARQRDGSRQNSTGPALIPFVTLTRARARQWSARCYGVARQRDGSRQNSTGVSGVLSLYPLARGCRRIWRGVVLVYWFRRRDAARPDRAAWAVQRLLAARWRGRRPDRHSWLRAPRVNPFCHP